MGTGEAEVWDIGNGRGGGNTKGRVGNILHTFHSKIGLVARVK
jgi:hypothetical protein